MFTIHGSFKLPVLTILCSFFLIFIVFILSAFKIEIFKDILKIKKSLQKTPMYFLSLIIEGNIGKEEIRKKVTD